MGSYTWGYKPPNIGVITIVILLITLLITTHELPSRALGLGFRRFRIFGRFGARGGLQIEVQGTCTLM